MTTRRPRYRIRQAALCWYLILAGPVDEVVAALITRAPTQHPDGILGAAVFFPTFAALGAVTIWAGERWLPKEHQQ